MTGVLERFSGYTFSTLMAEDAELMRLMEIEHAAVASDQEDEGW